MPERKTRETHVLVVVPKQSEQQQQRTQEAQMQKQNEEALIHKIEALMISELQKYGMINDAPIQEEKEAFWDEKDQNKAMRFKDETFLYHSLLPTSTSFC